MSDKKFFKFAAYLQIIGIILVVLGHSFHEYPDGAHGGNFLLNRLLHSFRMPLFIFVSGFLMTYTTTCTKKSWKGFVSEKIKRLLIPFFTLSLITFYPRSMMSGLSDEAVAPTAKNLLLSLIYFDYATISYFWFLQASFVLLITVYGFMILASRCKVPAKVFYPLLLTLCFALIYMGLPVPTIFSMHYVLALSVYFIAGCAYSHWMERMDRVVPWTNPLTMCAFFALWLAGFYASEWCGDFTWLCGLFGIMMMISLAKILEARHITVLDHLMGSNYLIFLLSWYFNVLTQQILSHFVALPWWVHTVLSISFGIYGPWLIFKWMQRNLSKRPVRILSTLLGQKFRRNLPALLIFPGIVTGLLPI